MTPWTDERCDLLRKLVAAKDLSYSDIADQLGGGLSRNACIGKAQRLGLERRNRAEYHAKLNRTKAKPKPTRVKRLTRTLSPHHFAIIEMDEQPVREFPASEIPIAQRKTIATIGFDDCRWPYGAPQSADFFFCGAPRIEGQPYCEAHCRIAYKPRPRVLSAE